MSVHELASGIDALYLSGRVELRDSFLAGFEFARDLARESGEPVPYQLHGVELGLHPYGHHRYAYRLSHKYGLVAFTGSNYLPAIHVEPKGETLHGLGPKATVEAFGDLLSVVGDIEWSVSRVDLFADIQGWWPRVDERDQFVCRATSRQTFEEHGELTGTQFGRRSRGAMTARVYEKTREAEKRGKTWWPEIWGDRFAVSKPVTRVEFEIGRRILREFGLDSPDDVFDSVAGLWGYATEWLSFRDSSSDQTKSRWPVSPDWEAIREVSLRDRPITLARSVGSKAVADEARMIAGLCGYASSFAASRNVDDLSDALFQVEPVLRQYLFDSGIPFDERVAKKRRRMEWGL